MSPYGKPDAYLSALLYLVETGESLSPDSEFGWLKKGVEDAGGSVPVSIRTYGRLNPYQFRRIVFVGVALSPDPTGPTERNRYFYSAKVPLDKVRTLAELPWVITIESTSLAPKKLH